MSNMNNMKYEPMNNMTFNTDDTASVLAIMLANAFSQYFSVYGDVYNITIDDDIFGSAFLSAAKDFGIKVRFDTKDIDNTLSFVESIVEFISDSKNSNEFSYLRYEDENLRIKVRDSISRKINDAINIMNNIHDINNITIQIADNAQMEVHCNPDGTFGIWIFANAISISEAAE